MSEDTLSASARDCVKMEKPTVNEERKKELEQKVQKSKEIIRQAFQKFAPEELAVAWTGGKDSTTMLWIVRQVCLEDNVPIPTAMLARALIRVSHSWLYPMEEETIDW